VATAQTAQAQHDSAQVVSLPGKIIMSRTDGEHTIEMVYWGATADPKITINVKCMTDLSFKLIPPLDDVMDYYNHPFGYSTYCHHMLTDADYNLVP